MVDPTTISMLQMKLQAFYSGNGDSPERRAMEQEIAQWRDSPEGVAIAWQLLDSNTNDVYLLWFAALVMEEAVNKRWGLSLRQQGLHDQLRGFILKTITQPRSRSVMLGY